jgi:hypothetical protein
LLNIRSSNIRSAADRKIRPHDDRVIINVCGDRYETYRSTLEQYPNSLLGNARRRQYYYDKERQEYFFDRNRSSFEAILYYYQSHGRLRRPNHVALDLFLEEVAFFLLGEEALSQIRKDENIKEVKKVRLPKNRFRRYLWATMEYPDFSRLAKLVNVLSLLMIVISTIVLAIETLPQYVNWDNLYCEKELNRSLPLNDSSNGTGAADDTYICHLYFTSAFFLVQMICVGFFTIEFLLRLVSTPSIVEFIKNPMNWIDLLAVVPFYVTVGIRVTGRQNQINTNSYVGLRLLRILRVARVFKFYRVCRSIKSLRVLMTTIKQSLLDFIIMITMLTLLAFLCGSAAYFAENDSNGEVFDSIPKATYWGIMTITSVGYGDMIPITPIGRMVACLCALSGSATIGVLVSVLVDRYQRVFARKLFVNEAPIDFDDYSDGESSDIELETHPQVTETLSALVPVPLSVQTALPSNSKQLHFIFGYVQDEEQDVSPDLLETVRAIIAEKQMAGHTLMFSLIAHEARRSHSPYDVKFELSSSEEEDEGGDQLTEIFGGSRSKGNVLKTFQRRSPEPNQQPSETEHHF